MRKRQLAIVGAASVLFLGGGAVGSQLAPETAAVETFPACGEGGPQIDTGLCGAQNAIKAFFHNAQGAGQFCKWKAANPGEWSRVKNMMNNPQTNPPDGVVTWFGASLRDLTQAYAWAQGSAYIIPPNTAANICKTPLAPPTNLRVTP